MRARPDAIVVVVVPLVCCSLIVAPVLSAAEVQEIVWIEPAGQDSPPFGAVSVTTGVSPTRQLATVTRVLLRLSALLAELPLASLTPVGLPRYCTPGFEK